MTITKTARLGLDIAGAGSDPHPTRVEHNAMIGRLESLVAMFSQGATADRPAAGVRGRMFKDTTVSRYYYDDGASWGEISTNGGGGSGRQIITSGNPAEGTSDRSARADHTHYLAPATTTAGGAMSPADKTKVDASTSSSTPGTLAQRDAGGRLQVNEPAAGNDAANKIYVDKIGANAAAGVHFHAASDVNSGVLNPDRLPTATTTAQGAMPATDRSALAAATSAATASRLVSRDAAGRARFAYPSDPLDVASKQYVDDEDAKHSLNGHRHTRSDITDLQLSALARGASAGSIVQRDGTENFETATPTYFLHAANKAYVDGKSVAVPSNQRPAHKDGLLVYETDTGYYRLSVGGVWHNVFTKYRIYTPTWSGLTDHGAGNLSEGEWSYLNPETVRVSARLRGGTGAILGNNRIFFTLPRLTANTAILQSGDAVVTLNGTSGLHRRAIVETGGNAPNAEVWAQPGRNERYYTLGEAGYQWGAGDEIHVNLTYKVDPGA